MKMNYKKGFTHSSVFHADDVFSAAFLKLLNPNIVIERGLKVPENYDGIVFDIGCGEFDHHQKDNECRENGLPYASFGKLWRAFAPNYFSEYVQRTVERNLIELLDAADNGVAANAISEAISAFNPVWDADESEEKCFKEAVGIASRILVAHIRKAQSQERAKKIVQKALEEAEDGIIVLPCYCPWGQVVMADPTAKFVIYPSQRGGYNIQTIPTKENSRVGRVLFPKKWLGNPDPDLGMTFCHPGNFLASTKTLEQAINVAQVAISMTRSPSST